MKVVVAAVRVVVVGYQSVETQSRPPTVGSHLVASQWKTSSAADPLVVAVVVALLQQLLKTLRTVLVVPVVALLLQQSSADDSASGTCKPLLGVYLCFCDFH